MGDVNAANAAKQVVAQLDAERNRLNYPVRSPEDRAKTQTNLEQLVAWYLQPPPRELPETTGA